MRHETGRFPQFRRIRIHCVPGEEKGVKKRGQVSFFGHLLGRVVVSRPRQTALLRVQLSSPKGKPRLTLWRSELSSASVSTLQPHERQFRGHGDPRELLASGVRQPSGSEQTRNFIASPLRVQQNSHEPGSARRTA